MGVTCRVRYLHPGPSTTSTPCFTSGRVQYLNSSSSSWKSCTLLTTLSDWPNWDFRDSSFIIITPGGFTSLLQILVNSFLQTRGHIHVGRTQGSPAPQSSLQPVRSVPVPEALDVLVRHEVPDEQVPIVLIELPLLRAQHVIVQGVAGTQGTR